MKYLRSTGRHQARRRSNHSYRRYGLAALALVFVGIAVTTMNAWRAGPATGTEPAQEIALSLPAGPATDSAKQHAKVPRTGSRRLPFEPRIRHSDFPATLPAQSAAASKWTQVTVAPGDNLSLIFSRLQLSKRDLHDIVERDGKQSVLKRLKPGQLLRFRIADNKLAEMEVEIDALNSLHIARGENGYAIRTVTIEPEIRVSAASAQIKHSLFLDGQKAGLSDALIMRMTQIFGWDIDFALDIRESDRFSVIYESVYKNNELIKQDRILAAEFVNQGKQHRAVLFTDAEGHSDYYSEDGKAMRKAFLRTPVNFTRISSRFNLRRKHPILNKIRAHKGVDYAAPHGTPVRAVANGKIRHVGRKGGYGRTVEMQHGKSYSTLYAHLSRFARGLKNGSKVKQGQVIGYVGKSGLATGPHLHYEFRVNGVHRNPLTIDLPKAESLDKKYLASFKRKAEPLLVQLSQLSAGQTDSDLRFIARVETPAIGAPQKATP